MTRVRVERVMRDRKPERATLCRSSLILTKWIRHLTAGLGCRAPLTSIIIPTPGAMESMGVGISVTCGLWLAERQRSWDLAVSERRLAYADI